MSDERRTTRQRRYLSLGLGELTAAAVFAAVALVTVVPMFNDEQGALALWAALVPLLAILLQAGAYWLLARSWVELRPMPLRVARLFRVLRVLDAALLVAGLVGVLLWLPAQPGLAILVVLVWLFGMIEYVNYFTVRLAYPVSQWARLIGQWRTPRLMQDVRSAA
ncbi:MAG TPA: hypothetical protein VNJ54_16685 [Plantibacter sp.]|uniref:hypothetical protein n=1 Tax=unclassified Plantibacter TaxID=2624265 RepID=UPI002BB4CA34|nr:hypothetical protein [Plantibacter sp.]